jgi:hypothetical protein
MDWPTAQPHRAPAERGTTKAETMSIYPLLLQGWDDASTWGEDNGHLYAQLTRNGVSKDGPEFWITPPRYPAVLIAADLAQVVAQATACGQETVLRGMATGAVLAGASPAERQRLDLPQ